MNKIIWIAFLVLGSSFALSAQAQPTPSASVVPLAHRIEMPREGMLPLLGHNVSNEEGAVVGQITNVLVDDSGQPLVAILDYGGFLGVGHRKIAVSMKVLRFIPAKNLTSITLKLDQLKGFPEYKPEGPIVVAGSPTDPDAAQ